jgi:hypothetical protein
MAGYGMKGHIMLNFQNSFGVSNTSSLYGIPQVSAGLVKSIEPINEENNYSRLDMPPVHQGKHSFEGDIELQANPIAIGYFLKSHIGLTGTTSDTGIQTHVFDPVSSDFDAYSALTPMTIEQHLDVGCAGLFQSMVGNTLNINMANGELLSFTAGFMGAGFTKKVPGTPTYPVAKPFKWDQMSGQWNGAAILDILDLTLSVNNNLEGIYTGVNCPVPIKVKRSSWRAIELTGTMVFQAHSMWQQHEAGSELPLVLNFATGQSPNSLKIDMPSIFLKTYEPTIAGPGIIQAPFTADVKFNVNSNTALTVTLINTYIAY